MLSSSFTLVKWYMDCVTPAGDTAILYCADLHSLGVHVKAASFLCSREGAVESHTSLTGFQLRTGPDQISIDIPRFAIAGTWQAAALPVERVVYERPDGSVHWNCLQPASTVQLTIKGQPRTGLGYAECLTLTLPPWKLPLQKLRWGRFVSESDSVVWMDWVGAHVAQFLFHNGVACTAQSIDKARIAWPGGTLRMEQCFPLRSGRLGDTIFPKAPALAKLLPRSLANIEEHKWRSRGILDIPGRQSQGWIIHEVVEWNQ